MRQMHNWFAGKDISGIQRKNHPIELILGADYMGYHPRPVATYGRHFILAEHEFGRCVYGRCKELNRVVPGFKILQFAIDNNFQITEKLKNFIYGEECGIAPPEKCFRCAKCIICLFPDGNMSYQESRELALIRSGLTFHEEGKYWSAALPWNQSLKNLKSNRGAVLAQFFQHEKRVFRNETTKKTYLARMQELFDRDYARVLTKAEIKE